VNCTPAITSLDITSKIPQGGVFGPCPFEENVMKHIRTICDKIFFMIGSFMLLTLMNLDYFKVKSLIRFVIYFEFNLNRIGKN
jgi:hypothetical protein